MKKGNRVIVKTSGKEEWIVKGTCVARMKETGFINVILEDGLVITTHVDNLRLENATNGAEEDGKMDKFDFLEMVSDIYSECESEDEINNRANEMIKLIESQAELSKGYLKLGIL